MSLARGLSQNRFTGEPSLVIREIRDVLWFDKVGTDLLASNFLFAASCLWAYSNVGEFWEEESQLSYPNNIITMKLRNQNIRGLPNQKELNGNQWKQARQLRSFKLNL